MNEGRVTDFSDIPHLQTNMVSTCVAAVILSDDGRAAIFHIGNTDGIKEMYTATRNSFSPDSSHVFLLGGHDAKTWRLGIMSVETVKDMEHNFRKMGFKVEGQYLYGPESCLDIVVTPDQTIHVRDSSEKISTYPKGKGLPGKLADEPEIPNQVFTPIEMAASCQIHVIVGTHAIPIKPQAMMYRR